MQHYISIIPVAFAANIPNSWKALLIRILPIASVLLGNGVISRAQTPVSANYQSWSFGITNANTGVISRQEGIRTVNIQEFATGPLYARSVLNTSKFKASVSTEMLITRTGSAGSLADSFFHFRINGPATFPAGSPAGRIPIVVTGTLTAAATNPTTFPLAVVIITGTSGINLSGASGDLVAQIARPADIQGPFRKTNIGLSVNNDYWISCRAYTYNQAIVAGTKYEANAEVTSIAIEPAYKAAHPELTLITEIPIGDGGPVNSLVITKQPQDRKTAAGEIWGFGVTATGSGTLSYQWLFNGDRLSNGTEIHGATEAELTLTNIALARAGRYSVVVSDSNGRSVTSSAATLTVVPSGIDVSGRQSDVDWAEVAAQQRTFAFVKATQGNRQMKVALFNAQMTGATRAGIVAGAYHFAEPQGSWLLVSERPDVVGPRIIPKFFAPVGAAQEAARFVEVAGKYIKQGYLRPALDLEDPPGLNAHPLNSITALGQAGLGTWVRTWLDTVWRLTNVRPFVYTTKSTAIFLDIPANADIFANYPLWIPDLTPNDPTANPSALKGWSQYTMKQYSFPPPERSDARPGLGQKYLLDCFNGTLQSFYDIAVIGPTNYGNDVVIVSPPANKQINAGQSAEFSVIATGNRPMTYIWTFNGVPIGTASSSLSLRNVQTSSAGTYSVTVLNGTGKPASAQAKLTIHGASNASQFSSQPVSQTVTSGGTAIFSASADPAPSAGILGGKQIAAASSPISYQWLFNGDALPHATASILVVSGIGSESVGDYSCIATNNGISSVSNTARLKVSRNPEIGRLINLSCRAQIGDGALITGFVVGCSDPTLSQPVLIRASGPALLPFGVSGLADPTLQLFGNGSSLLAINRGWSGSSNIIATAASVGAFPWLNLSSHDAALVQTLGRGPYSSTIASSSKNSGITLAEIYDATPSGTYSPALPRLINVSALTDVGTDSNVLIAGFVIGGSTSKSVLIRASGPALNRFGVSGTIADPVLRLFDGTGRLVAVNAGWEANPSISMVSNSVGAFSWGAKATLDSAVLVTLPPGAYSAQISGSNGHIGKALIEVYDVEPVDIVTEGIYGEP